MGPSLLKTSHTVAEIYQLCQDLLLSTVARIFSALSAAAQGKLLYVQVWQNLQCSRLYGTV